MNGLNSWISFVAQTAPAQPALEQNPMAKLLTTMGPLIFIFVIFYFLLIRPANKKQKTLQAMIENLKSGDKVITTGGILGVVSGISDEVIHLRIAPNVKIEVARNAIAALQKDGPEKEQSS